jgi:lysophospholipase L1-like esterase
MLQFGLRNEKSAEQVRRGPAKAPKRHRRPLQFDAMEQRTMLSITIAALGDSLTDEYQFYAPYETAADNWPEILANLRSSQVSLGAFTTSSQGQTRNQGYAQNWAFNGATAEGDDIDGDGTTFAEQYAGGFQPGAPGLLTQAGGISNINFVNILIGTNDYRAAIKESVANPLSLASNLTTADTNILTAIETVVPAIQAANSSTHILLDTLPPIAEFPYLTELLTAEPSAIASYVTSALNTAEATANAQIVQYAQSKGAGVVDFNTLMSNFVTNPSFDGVSINPNGAGPLYTDMFVGDGIHPGTILQGILANGIIAQIDAFDPGAITPLSDAEILQLAASAQLTTQSTLTQSAATLLPGGTVTFTAQIASFAPNYETSASPAAPNDLEPYPTPTGTVQFVDTTDGNQVLGNASLNASGVATFTASSMSAGVNTIEAIYSGDSVYPGTTTTSVTVADWTSKQTKTYKFIQTHEKQSHVVIPQAQINQWLTSLDSGVKPPKIQAAVQKYIRTHMHHGKNKVVLARLKPAAERRNAILLDQEHLTGGAAD